MSVVNCRECGKVHRMDRSPYCEDCKPGQDDLYRMVRDYVRDHQQSTLLDIHLNTGVPISKLLEMQKDNYLFSS